MTNEDVGLYGNTTLAESDPQLYRSVGTTLSAVNEADPNDVAEATVSGKVSDQQPNLWLIGSHNLTNFQTFYDQPDLASGTVQQTGFSPRPFFTSSIPVDTDTGVLSALAYRLSTTLSCEEISHSSFPASCDGSAPFATNYSNANLSVAKTNFYGGPIFTFRACAPGNFSWIPSDNKQDISEEFYMDFQSSLSPAEYNYFNGKVDSIGSIIYNFTYHCTTNSTLAYFQPPSYWNRHEVQDIVDLGPKSALLPTGPNARFQPQNLSASLKVSGPFLTSILALFGKDTFFDNIAKANDTHDNNLEVCQALRMPLTGLCTGEESMCNPYNFSSGSPGPVLDCLNPGDEDPANPITDPKDQHPTGTLASYLFLFLQRFNNLNSTNAALTLTNFYSSLAMLDTSKALDATYFEPSFGQVAEVIYASPGLNIQKLHAPLAGLIIISVLIIFQLTGLFLLAVYASSYPTWTSSLDSFALLRMGAAMADELPLISALEAKELAVLDEKAGWVGDAGDGEKVGLLRIGGEERIRQDTAYQSVGPGRTIKIRKESVGW